MIDNKMNILKQLRKADNVEEICNLSLKYLYEARNEYKIIVAEEKLRRFMVKGYKTIEKEVERLTSINSDKVILDTYKNTILGINEVIDKTVIKGELFYTVHKWFQRDAKILISKLYGMEGVIFSKYILDKVKIILEYSMNKDNEYNSDLNSKVLELIELFIGLFNDILYQNEDSGRTLIYEIGGCLEAANPCHCPECGHEDILFGYANTTGLCHNFYKDIMFGRSFNLKNRNIDQYDLSDDDDYSEYNIKPGDPDYEFSMAEALDNMYGK